MTATLRSMTGYGRGEATCSSAVFDVEVKSLNHRFLDVSIKAPRGYSHIESALRSEVSQVLARGKCEITIYRRAVETSSHAVPAIPFRRAHFDAYLKLYKELLGEFASGMRPESFERALGEILSRPGVIADAASDLPEVTDEESDCIMRALRAALTKLVESRVSEGRAAAVDIEARLQELQDSVEAIGQQTATLSSEAQKRLEDRMRKLFPSTAFDELRLVQEAGFIAERLDVSEELARLRQHLAAFEQALHAPAPGKRLDFVVQEIGRECNTIASKVQNASISHRVVDAKVTLEKIREQLQNIE